MMKRDGRTLKPNSGGTLLVRMHETGTICSAYMRRRCLREEAHPTERVRPVVMSGAEIIDVYDPNETTSSDDYGLQPVYRHNAVFDT